MTAKSKFIPMLMIGSALTVLTFVSGCKKNDSVTDDFSSDAEEIGQSESIYTDVDNMVSQVALSGGVDQKTRSTALDPNEQFGFSTCATVTKDSVNHIITIDFGTGCVGHDGKTRSGIIRINYTGGGYFDPGASWTVTFDNFYVGGRHVEGTRTVTNNGMNASNNMTWSINAVNMSITKPDGSSRTWNSQRTREMIAGYGDSTWTNDVYRINGTASGTRSNGISYSAVLTDLIRDRSCYFITSGTIAITPANKPVRTIDFGNGTCDDVATVTLNGNSRTIHLRP